MMTVESWRTGFKFEEKFDVFNGDVKLELHITVFAGKVSVEVDTLEWLGESLISSPLEVVRNGRFIGCLTNRQMSILIGWTEGELREEAAERLAISVATVKRETRFIEGVFGVKDKASAVAVAIQHGLFDMLCVKKGEVVKNPNVEWIENDFDSERLSEQLSTIRSVSSVGRINEKEKVTA